MFREAEAIILNVCLAEGVSTDLICSPMKTRNVVRVRRIIVTRLRQETNLSWAEIEFSLGKPARTLRRSLKK